MKSHIAVIVGMFIYIQPMIMYKYLCQMILIIGLFLVGDIGKVVNKVKINSVSQKVCV